MTDAPDVDGRGEDDLRQHVREIAPYYVPAWDPDEGGVGTGLVDIFAELAAGVVERLDAAPAKHRVAFYDALGFDAEPPQPARVPVQLRLDENAPRNVRVRPGTTALAETDEEVAFRVGEAAAFEATPARLTDVVAVDPAADAVFEHDGVIDGAGDETLFDGENVQAHAWYLGDADLLTVGAGTTVTVSLETTAEPAVVRDALVWEFHGEPGDDGAAGDDPAGDGVADDDPTDDGVADDPTDDGVKPTPDWYAIEDPVLVPETPDGVVAIDLELAGELTETTVDGVESKWLRVRLAPDLTPDGSRAFQVDRVTLGLVPEPQTPDQLLANDVPLAVDGGAETSIAPFGETPRLGDTFYLAAGDAFTKPNSRATIAFHGDLDLDDGPTVSWEYWNGSGWAGLADLDDGTASFTHGVDDGVDVSFTVPPDLAATSVAGHEAHWIRARLVGGEFGQVSYREEEENERWVRIESDEPPQYDTVTVRYALADVQRPAHVVTHNALAYEHVDPADGSYRPFRALSESTQTLYLGFDRALAGGPIQLFVDVADRAFPPWFAPRIRWERASDPLADAWVRIPTSDGTESLTERGIVALSFDESPVAFERFGTERHWIRARVRASPFATAASTAPTTDETGGGAIATSATLGSRGIAAPVESTHGDRAVPTLDEPVIAAIGRRLEVVDGTFEHTVGGRRTPPRSGPQPCSEFVATEPPGGEPTTASPTVAGLYLNAGWARNVEAVADEVLGGSDGERGQAFAVANPPVLEPTLWVDESSALSVPQMSTLETARPADVIRETGSDGAVRAFWVRWAHVDTFVDSDGSDRHYVLDRVEGRVRFGDGNRGRIPPRGSDNVRASYVTGGGRTGNVPAGTVTDLKSGLPFVEAVTNPVAGFGGAEAEETDDVLERAPRELRDRNRAVTPADFERLAVDASRLVARARCFAGMDRAGAYAPGWVTVLLVPDDGSERPAPSTGLLETVEESLSAHAPVALVARDRLVVRGPSYVGVGVDADVVVSKADTLGAIEERVEAALAAFLHPLTGGHERTGWRFGELPSRSDVFAVLEGIAGVDHVASLSLVFEGDGTVTSTEGVEPPTTSPDALVYGATHDLALRRAVGPGGGA